MSLLMKIPQKSLNNTIFLTFGHVPDKKTPLKKVVEPEDVALAIIGCITHLKTATGTRIVIDGGKNL